MVRAYKGSHSGEHGDGLVRSEFHSFMFGDRLVSAFAEVKDRFDPKGLFNPGKITRAPKFDDRTNFRFAPGYRGLDLKTELDWSAWPGAGGGFQGAVEMCNNNGACRKMQGGAMCPSYRVTRDEKDVTRGRANTLRLALTGQLGPDALTSEEMMETLKLCVSCKACRRECPTGVDMARMKIEVLAARTKKYGLTLHQRLVGYLPRYAPYAAKLPWLFNLRDRLPGAAKLSEAIAGFSARRTLPQWRRDIFRDDDVSPPPLWGRSSAEGGREGGQATGVAISSSPLPNPPPQGGREQAERDGKDVVLFADTFNRYFEREVIEDAIRVLRAGGYHMHLVRPRDGTARPLCCGRTFLSVGCVGEARREAERTLDALAPYVARGVPVVGLEPSCILGFRDEIPATIGGDVARKLSELALTFEEFLAREQKAGRLALPLGPLKRDVLIHGHCHQKSFDAFGAVSAVVKLVPDAAVQTIESSCCGMAGSFGYNPETIDVSLAMGELSLLPAVREAAGDTIVVADGTSCRHQIQDGAGRKAIHVAQLLALSIASAQRRP
jgi:Fe-S oxidoreductase